MIQQLRQQMKCHCNNSRWKVGQWVGRSSQTEQTYLQWGKYNQDLNEVIDKEGRLALNLSDCQKCPAVYILHETGRKKKNIYKVIISL